MRLAAAAVCIAEELLEHDEELSEGSGG